MLWFIAFFIVSAIISAVFDTVLGRLSVAAAILAIGCLVISWITEIAFFITLAKICAVVIVVMIVLQLLMALF